MAGNHLRIVQPRDLTDAHATGTPIDPGSPAHAVQPANQRGSRSMSRAGDALRIACWSGPRNISTAMMRAWQNRADTVVSDEPLYAHYLAETGAEDPARDRILAQGDCDWRRVVQQLVGPVPDGRAVWYQKHMTHHLLPEVARGWLRRVVNCFLVRQPREVLLACGRDRLPGSAEELGLPQQAEIFDAVCEITGAAPVVIDAGDMLREPEELLRAWCGRLGLAFDPAMLRCQSLPHVPAAAAQRQVVTRLPTGFEALLEECEGYYQKLYVHRLRPQPAPRTATRSG